MASRLVAPGGTETRSVIATVIPYEVIGRCVFQKMTIWSGEVSTYSLVWASMLGGAVGLKKGYMIGMTSVVESVPPAAARALKLVSYLCALFFFGVMFGPSGRRFSFPLSCWPS